MLDGVASQIGTAYAQLEDDVARINAATTTGDKMAASTDLMMHTTEATIINESVSKTVKSVKDGNKTNCSSM